MTEQAFATTRPAGGPATAPAAPDPELLAQLAAIVGARYVLHRRSELLVYTSDGLPGYRKHPTLGVFPGTRDELVAVVRALAARGVPFVPRGAGTGLSGGALADGVVLVGLNRLNRVLSVDAVNRRALVEPGVVNVALTKAAAPYGLHYAPDPSSQAACTIGGNIAENAGGPHCLKYGVTLNHVLAIEAVLPDGDIVTLGSPDGERDGYDLLGAFIGSEGCFGIALTVTVRLSPNPQAVRTLLADFLSIDGAARATSAIIASGILPAALELMDGPMIRAVEASVYAAGYPVDAAAVLLIELDGLEAGLDTDVGRVNALCRDCGARDVRIARDDAERNRLWQGRKKAFGAMGRVSPHLVVQDAVIPRTKLPELLAAINAIAARHRILVCNVFHAGDGNLHPLVAYGDEPGEEARAHAATREIMRACVDAGGTVTGEHGIGLDKLEYMDLIFSPASLDAMCRVRDVLDPARLANPGKVVPVRRCLEWVGAGGAKWGRLMREQGLGNREQTPPSARASALTAEAASVPASLFPVPSSVDDIVSIVRQAASDRAPLRIVGTGTWLDAGRPVDERATPLSLRSLSGIVEYNPGDLTLTALAGTTLGEIARATGAHGQWLALDPFGAEDATIGATIATASAGPLASALGLPRDLVLGVEMVSGTGEIVNGGGRVVKNVAGFDLTRLVVGSWGTLAVLTAVTVRLRAVPEHEATVAMPLGDAESLGALAERLRAAPVAPIALEALSAPLAARLGLGASAVLLARLAGNAESIASQRGVLASISDAMETTLPVWRALRAIEPERASVIRLSALPSHIAETWSAALALAGAVDGGLAHASVARGVARCILPSMSADVVGRALASASFDGARVFERLPRELWAAAAPSAVHDRLSQGIQRAFDPSGILNPGVLGAVDQ